MSDGEWFVWVHFFRSKRLKANWWEIHAGNVKTLWQREMEIKTSQGKLLTGGSNERTHYCKGVPPCKSSLPLLFQRLYTQSPWDRRVQHVLQHARHAAATSVLCVLKKRRENCGEKKTGFTVAGNWHETSKLLSHYCVIIIYFKCSRFRKPSLSA